MKTKQQIIEGLKEEWRNYNKGRGMSGSIFDDAEIWWLSKLSLLEAEEDYKNVGSFLPQLKLKKGWTIILKANSKVDHVKKEITFGDEAKEEDVEKIYNEGYEDGQSDASNGIKPKEEKELVDLGENSTCGVCHLRKCICPERQPDGSWKPKGDLYYLGEMGDEEKIAVYTKEKITKRYSEDCLANRHKICDFSKCDCKCHPKEEKCKCFGNGLDNEVRYYDPNCPIHKFIPKEEKDLGEEDVCLICQSRYCKCPDLPQKIEDKIIQIVYEGGLVYKLLTSSGRIFEFTDDYRDKRVREIELPTLNLLLHKEMK